MQSERVWTFQPFGELSGQDVYEVLQLRAAVFVVEQDCAYLDPDGQDQGAWHGLCREQGRLVAYQRCLPPGEASPRDSALGRIVVDPALRGQDLGRELVRRGIAFNRHTWPDHAILIGAQAHLQQFYGSLGFESCSEEYLEDGIPHVHMRLPAEAPIA